MHGRQKRRSTQTAVYSSRILAAAFLLLAAARCGSTGPTKSEATLRIGAGEVEIGQIVQNQTLEGLATLDENGRLIPRLAQGWTVSDDGLSLVVKVRTGTSFHDGSPVSAQVVAQVLKDKLPGFMGVAYEDVLSIEAISANEVALRLRQPSQFVLESLEVQIQKPGTSNIGTGPFIAGPSGSPIEMRANPNYYLGRPNIDRIVINRYPSVRTAWAEMLRNNLDMVYEVGTDALDSLDTAKTVGVFSFVRRYQYVILLNLQVPALRSVGVRRGLNAAIDRASLIQDGLGGHGVSSTGPVWPKHWAFSNSMPEFIYDPKFAASTFGRTNGDHLDALHTLKFTCLATADEERIALVIKRQLESVGVEMNIEVTPLDNLSKAGASGKFEAILAPTISAPTLFRPYMWWHSHGPFNRGSYSSAPVDAALDTIRGARSDDEYRQGVADFQRSIVADPPAIFLAWDERARAVSNRFSVPAETGGVDILSVLRLWRPVAGAGHPGSN